MTETDLIDAQDVIDLDLEKEITETEVEIEIAKENVKKKGESSLHCCNSEELVTHSFQIHVVQVLQN